MIIHYNEDVLAAVYTIMEEREMSLTAVHLLASERSERAQSLFMSIEISYIYICGHTSTSTRMPGKSLLRNGLSN